MEDKIKQATKEIRAWAKEPGRAEDNPTRPQAITDENPETIGTDLSEPQLNDYYQMKANDAQEASKKASSYGSPAEVNQVVDNMVSETAEKYFNAYNNQYQHLLDANDPNGAQRTADEYMMQYALPMVASLVEMYGVDSILNNKKALSKLDKVMLTGNGEGEGYTRAYLKQMYNQAMGAQGSFSDAEVVRGIQQATGIADRGDIRGAIGIAKSLKEKIDNGELSASESDYNTLITAIGGR